MSNAINENKSLIDDWASHLNCDPTKLMNTLATCIFKKPVTSEELMSFLLVARKLDLDPFRKEIYPSVNKKGVLIPVVSIDGWLKLINSQPTFDGIEVEFSEEMVTKKVISEEVMKEISTTGPSWCKVTIYRKDRTHPTVITEYFNEVFRRTEQWMGMPYRMLRHKTIIQCARVAFSFAGYYDEDEAERITNSEKRAEINITPAKPALEGVTSEPIVVPALTPAAPVPEPVYQTRSFENQTALAQQVDSVIQRCLQKNVLPKAVDYFQTRLKGEDLAFALQRYEEVKAELEQAA